MPVKSTSTARESLSQFIALNDIENPIVRQGIVYWAGLCRGRRYPARSDVTPRGLKGMLRNTTLLKVVDGGRDYEYRIIGDAYVMAHGRSYQGLKWSETARFSPGYHASIKPVYDSVVRTGEPMATRGWIEKGNRAREHVYCEYVFLPLGSEERGVDHILVFAVYVAKPMIVTAAF